MPNGLEDFDKKIAEWERQTQLHYEQIQSGQKLISDYMRQAEEQAQRTTLERLITGAKGVAVKFAPPLPPLGPIIGPLAAHPLTAPLLVSYLFFGRPEAEKVKLRADLATAYSAVEKSDFFARLYGEVPFAISAGLVSTPDEVLALLKPPDTLTTVELSDVQSAILDMITTITRPPEEIPLEAREVEEEYPELVAPPEREPLPGPIGIHKLTTQEILKYLKIPRVPEGAMSKEQWEEFLKLKGYTDEDIDMELQLKAEELITSWQDRNSQIAAFKTGLAEMPEYKLTDMLKEMVVQPGLALAEVAMVYFEHVSMPLAGALYKNFIPDLEAEYQRFKQSNPDASDREALVHAWVAWDSPFEGWQQWVLKYMLMEGIVDPLTYVGWGIAAKLTKPIPYLGRLVGAAERGAMSVFELPFDGVKWIVRKFPKTLTQRATMAQHQASQYVERYITKATGRHISSISMRDFTRASERAIKYALANPQLEDDIALAGREMLRHAPVDEALTKDWATRLGTTLRAEDITRVTVENLDNLFEDMFAKKLITPREASGQLLKIFNVGEMTDDVLKAAQRMLETRAATIERGAIAFTKAKTPLAAMRSLASKNFRTHLVAEESAAALARKETGAFSTLLHNVDLRLQGIWRNGIDRWVVRPFAESYLTFGMYGPMNVLEDYIRSTLGGVFPRRMNIEAWEKVTVGLKVDPELKRYGISEMIGPLAREAPEQNWNNWILQLFALGQKNWADKIYKTLVRLPGAYGMDVRRNFLSKRYLQLLAEAGGKEFKALAAVGPRGLPKLADRALLKDLESTVYSLKTTGNPDAIRGAKDLFTRQRVVRNEVNNILKEHPELPNSARDYIMRAYDEDVIFREAGESIEKTIGETRSILLDDFIRGPETATQQYHQLADFLAALEVRNPQEMASAIQAVYKMSEIYGALPDQIIAQATIRSRGLSLAERRATFDADFDRIYMFLDSAGADIDRVVNKLKLTTTKPSEMIDWGRVTFGAGISPEHQSVIRGAVDNLPLDIKVSVRGFTIDKEACEVLGKEVGAFWNPQTQSIVFKDTTKITEGTIYHEIAHSAIDDILERGDTELLARFAETIGRLDDAQRIRITGSAEYTQFQRVHEDFAIYFKHYIQHGKRPFLPSDLPKGQYGWGEKAYDFFVDSFPKTQRALPFTEGYKDASIRTFDIMTAKRQYATEFRAQNMATRHDYFAGVAKKEMTPDFWDNFYLQMGNESRIFNTRMAELDGQLVRAIEGMNIAAGAKITPRSPVVVKERPLAPQDIATLLGVRGDDISRALLDVLTVQNNKDYFVAYVRGMTRTGDVGFTKEAIGAVYDQISYSLRVSPESMSWITSKQMELDAVRKELHSLYNSKMLPDEEIAAIGRYLDETASAVENLTIKSQGAPIRMEAKLAKGEQLLYHQTNAAAGIQRTGFVVGEGAGVIKAGRLELPGVYLKSEPGLVRPDIIGREQLAVRTKITNPIEFASPEAFATWRKSVGIRDAKLPAMFDLVEPGTALSRSLERQHTETLAALRGRGHDAVIIVKDPIPDTPGEFIRTTIVLDPANVTPVAPMVGFEDQMAKIVALEKERDGIARESAKRATKETGVPHEYVPHRYYGKWGIEEEEKVMARMLKEFEALRKVKPDMPIVGREERVLRPEYANFDDLRQSSMDEAHKWYYKEYPDYTNANAFDAMMKTIYPYWTYESQRWFWLPRAFVRHPGVFTTFERWQNNSDYGYIHIPGTSVDINPFRGTIFGTLTTRLTRRDFPEYYDSLGAAKGMIEFNDYLSRFGFYPGAHINIPLSMMGGLEQQMGETIPAIWKTPLNALIAARPESESVKWLSDHIFSDRFREYMTILMVNKRGYNGSHIWTKVRENIPLTEEEQAVWDSARGEAALHGVGFEQFGLFRLRSDEQYKAYEESAKVIEEMTGYTPEQQDWLRRHGYRIWDMVGGISPTNQAILQELESYKWLGTVTPLLPSRQQQELRRLDLDWDDVMQFAESGQDKRLHIQQDFLAGRIGPRDYIDRLQTSYTEQRDYIDKKMEDNPNMTLEGRAEYYKKYGIPIPVQHPMRELLNLYFSIELNTEAIEPETGEIYTDWDSFFAQRGAIEDAILPEQKEEWEAYLSRNTTRMEEIRREVSNTYFRKYYDVWEATLASYPENEQALINEYLFLERTVQKLGRQAEIKAMVSTKTGNKLISSFRSDVSDNRAALRYTNPHLDAWLFFWGRVTSFKTPQAELIYQQISRDIGRIV